jgi:dCMP deaminase
MSTQRSGEWWDKYFLGLAQYISTASKDPSTKVGAVIIDSQRRIVSTGYNGFPRGIKDTYNRLNDRDQKYPRIVHAERNAIIFAQKDLYDHTIYSWPFLCCSPCAGMIIQAGIKRVVTPFNNNERWKKDFLISIDILKEASVGLSIMNLTEPQLPTYYTIYEYKEILERTV